MKYILSTLLLALSLVVAKAAATPLSSPVLTNFNEESFVIDYFGVPTNIIKLRTTGNIFIRNDTNGIGIDTLTNVVFNTIITTNLFVDNFFVTVTNNYFTNLYVSNFFATNITVNDITVESNAYFSTVYIGITNTYLTQTNFVINGTNVATLADLVWTNNNGIVMPLVGNEVYATNLTTFRQLLIGGSQIDGGGYSTNLVAGTNNLDLTFACYVQIFGDSADPSTSSISLSSIGAHQNIKLENYLNNSGFTLFNGSECWNDPTTHVLLNGDWTPTRRGEAIYLWQDNHGDWVELGRASASTNGGNPLWEVVGGTTLQPQDLTLDVLVGKSLTIDTTEFAKFFPSAADGVTPYQLNTSITHNSGNLFELGSGGAIPFYIDHVGNIGMGFPTNIFAGKTIGMSRQVDLDGPDPIFVNGGIVDTWPNPHHGSEWWFKLLTNEAVMTLTTLVLPSGSGHSYDHVWYSTLDGANFYYLMKDNTTNKIMLDARAADITLEGKIGFGFNYTNILQRYSGQMALSNHFSQYSTLYLNSTNGVGGYLQGYNNAGYAGITSFGNDYAELAYSGGQATLNVDGFRPNAAHSIPLGTSSIEWKNLHVNDSVTITPYIDGTNYSQVVISHTGTNGAVVFDSQSSGIAGNPRPFNFTDADLRLSNIPLGSSGTIINPPTTADCYITNMFFGALSAGTNLVYTVPSGYKFIFQKGSAAPDTNNTTIWYGISNAVVYPTSSASTAITTNGNSYSNYQILEEGESLALYGSGSLARSFVSGIVITNTVAVKTVRLTSVAATTNLVYTVPAGKTAMPYVAAGNNAISLQYYNFSGSPVTASWYVVPSGGSIDSTTRLVVNSVVDKSNGTLNGGPLYLQAGTSVILESSSATDGQTALITLFEF